MRLLIILMAACLTIGTAYSQIGAGAALPTPANTPVRSMTRVNVGLSNPSSNNAQDGATIVNRGKNYYAAWADQGGLSNGFQDIYFAKSIDGGLSWSAPVRVDIADGVNVTDAQFPSIVFADKSSIPAPGQPSYNIVVVYESSIAYGPGASIDDVAVVYSEDDGSTWATSTPHLVNDASGVLGSEIDEIWVTSEGSNVYVTWEQDGVSQTGFDPSTCPNGGEVVGFTRSLDGGLSFEPAQVISTPSLITPTDPCSNQDINNPMVVADGQNVMVSYTDNFSGTRDIVVAVSSSAGAPGSWNNLLIESDQAGDVNSPRIVRTQLSQGGTVWALAWEDNSSGQWTLNASWSLDMVTWLPEVVVSPNVLANPGSGVSSNYQGYHSHVVTPDGRVQLVWLDDSEAGSLGQGPSSGDSSASRQAYFSALDLNGSIIVPALSIDPGRTNQFPSLVSNGDNIFIHFETNPYGANDLYYAVSTDGGISFSNFLVTASPLGDSDSVGGRRGRSFAADWESMTANSIFWNNPLGQNEIYVSGLRIPYLTRTDDPATGLSTLGVAGVPLTNSSTGFQLGLSTLGNLPAIPLGTNYVGIALDPNLTILSLTDPFLLPFLSGPVDSSGNGFATASFPTSTLTGGLFAAPVSPGISLLLGDAHSF